MPKLICPVRHCVQTDFGVPIICQQDIDNHMISVHGIRNSQANRNYWRKQQDKTYRKLLARIEEDLELAGTAHRKRMKAKQKASLAPMDSDEDVEEMEDLQMAHAALINVPDSDPERAADESKASIEATVNINAEEPEDSRRKTKYAASLRYHQRAEGKAVAQMKRETVHRSVIEKTAELLRRIADRAMGDERAGNEDESVEERVEGLEQAVEQGKGMSERGTQSSAATTQEHPRRATLLADHQYVESNSGHRAGKDKGPRRPGLLGVDDEASRVVSLSRPDPGTR